MSLNNALSNLEHTADYLDYQEGVQQDLLDNVRHLTAVVKRSNRVSSELLTALSTLREEVKKIIDEGYQEQLITDIDEVISCLTNSQ